MAIPQSLRDLLKTGPLGHLVTLDPDGTPRVTLGWAGFDGEELILATFPDQPKLDNIRRDPRVVVSFLSPDEAPEGGLHPYAVINGRGRVVEGGALEWMDELSEYYIGPGQKFWWREAPPGFKIHVEIDRIYGVGPWARSA